MGKEPVFRGSKACSNPKAECKLDRRIEDKRERKLSPEVYCFLSQVKVCFCSFTKTML
jgi:hypothetical protein